MPLGVPLAQSHLLPFSISNFNPICSSRSNKDLIQRVVRFHFRANLQLALPEQHFLSGFECCYVSLVSLGLGSQLGDLRIPLIARSHVPDPCDPFSKSFRIVIHSFSPRNYWNLGVIIFPFRLHLSICSFGFTVMVVWRLKFVSTSGC